MPPRFRLPLPALAGLATSLLLALAAPHAAAATWYTVEVIVFERLDSAAASAEVWPADPGEPSLASVVELTAGLDAELDPELAGAPHAFQLLGAGEHRMDGIRQRLRSAGFRLLAHLGWRQPGFGRSRAPAVHLRSGEPLIRSEASGAGSPPTGPSGLPAYAAGATVGGHVVSAVFPTPAGPTVDGTLRLYRSRYLHLEADLLYFRPGLEAAGGAAPLFRLQESRRMRSGEVHYLDHPLLAIIVQVTPFNPGGGAADEAGSTSEEQARGETASGAAADEPPDEEAAAPAPSQ